MVAYRELCIHQVSSPLRYCHYVFREFKKATTATATGTSPNKRFNELNNGCARAF